MLVFLEGFPPNKWCPHALLMCDGVFNHGSLVHMLFYAHMILHCMCYLLL